MKFFGYVAFVFWLMGAIVMCLPFEFATTFALLLWSVPAGWGAGDAVYEIRKSQRESRV